MTTTPRNYHHGDLHAALLREAIGLVRVSGPGGLTLREVARRAGVSANAPYRHFRDRGALVQSVTFLAQAECARVMEARLVPGQPALMRLYAVGTGYVQFARSEPGMFEAAFLEPVDLALATDSRAAGDSGRTPYQHLSDALDALVEAGQLPSAARPDAEVPCWSSVHGLAMLAVRGPLRTLPPEQLDALTDRVIMSLIPGLLSIVPEAQGIPDDDGDRGSRQPAAFGRLTAMSDQNSLPTAHDVPDELLPDSARDTMEEQVDAGQPYGEVTAEDLATDDLLQDGADLMTGGSPTPMSVLINEDERTDETIDQRLAQEEYDPDSAIVPATDVDLTEADVIEEAELEGDLAEVPELEAEADAADATDKDS